MMIVFCINTSGLVLSKLLVILLYLGKRALFTKVAFLRMLVRLLKFHDVPVK